MKQKVSLLLKVIILSLTFSDSSYADPLSITPEIQKKAAILSDQSPPQARFDLARWNWKIKQKKQNSSPPSRPSTPSDRQQAHPLQPVRCHPLPRAEGAARADHGARRPGGVAVPGLPRQRPRRVIL